MKNQKKSSGLGISFSKAKIVFNFYPWWRRAAKAKKMTKMIVKDELTTEEIKWLISSYISGDVMAI
jgi:hypothetical protein